MVSNLSKYRLRLFYYSIKAILDSIGICLKLPIVAEHGEGQVTGPIWANMRPMSGHGNSGKPRLQVGGTGLVRSPNTAVPTRT